MADKTMTEEDVVGRLRSGMTIAIGGWASRRKPMALVRAILRSDLRDLTVVTHGGPDLGLLCAAGKVRRRLVPFLFLLYIFAYLDRINVGFASLQMNQALGFSAAVYGFGAGIFFLSYTAFEIPSNIILARVGARRWIARIMITWGLASAAMMFVHDAASFYTLRFVLGAALLLLVP